MDLTKRQQEIFDFIRRYSASNGYPPTVRDIGKAVGLASSSTVHQHLANLERIGLLRRDPSKPRAIELLDRAVGGAGQRARDRAPSGCRCWARSPPASRCSPRRTSRSTSSVPDAAGGDDGDYLLRVRGESMKNVGILEGDLVVVRRRRRRRRRHRRRARRRGGDRQALLPRGRPRPPAARERRDGADPQPRGPHPRPRRRPDARDQC